MFLHFFFSPSPLKTGVKFNDRCMYMHFLLYGKLIDLKVIVTKARNGGEGGVLL